MPLRTRVATLATALAVALAFTACASTVGGVGRGSGAPAAPTADGPRRRPHRRRRAPRRRRSHRWPARQPRARRATRSRRSRACRECCPPTGALSSTRWSPNASSSTPSPAQAPPQCRPGIEGGTAITCRADLTLYISHAFLALIDRFFHGLDRALALASVASHEFGHVLQYTLHQPQIEQKRPSDATSQFVEQQADCLSGVWAGSAAGQHNLDANEFVDDAEKLIELVSSNPEIETHGTPPTRRAAIERGIAGGSRRRVQPGELPLMRRLALALVAATFLVAHGLRAHRRRHAGRRLVPRPQLLPHVERADRGVSERLALEVLDGPPGPPRATHRGRRSQPRAGSDRLSRRAAAEHRVQLPDRRQGVPDSTVPAAHAHDRRAEPGVGPHRHDARPRDGPHPAVRRARARRDAAAQHLGAVAVHRAAGRLPCRCVGGVRRHRRRVVPARECRWCSRSSTAGGSGARTAPARAAGRGPSRPAGAQPRPRAGCGYAADVAIRTNARATGHAPLRGVADDGCRPRRPRHVHAAERHALVSALEDERRMRPRSSTCPCRRRGDCRCRPCSGGSSPPLRAAGAAHDQNRRTSATVVYAPPSPLPTTGSANTLVRPSSR